MKKILDAGFDRFLSRLPIARSSGPEGVEQTRQLSATNMIGGKFGKDATMYLGSDQVQIDGKLRRITVRDGTRDRVRIGNLGSNRYGIEMFDSSGTVIMDETKIQMQYVFSTFMTSANDATGAVLTGAVRFVDSAFAGSNNVVILDFIKPSDITISSVTLYIRFRVALDGAGTTSRVTKAHVYLNPTETITTSTFGTKYTLFSGGTDILADYSPSSDSEDKTVVWTAGMISAINDGTLSRIVLQSNENDVTKMGFASMNLVMNGYLSW